MKKPIEVLKPLAWETHVKGLTDRQKQIVKLYNKGRSKLGIAKDVGVTRSYVYETLIKQGLVISEGNYSFRKSNSR